MQAAVAHAAVALVDAHLRPLHTYTRWVEVRMRGHPALICRAMHAKPDHGVGSMAASGTRSSTDG